MYKNNSIKSLKIDFLILFANRSKIRVPLKRNEDFKFAAKLYLFLL